MFDSWRCYRNRCADIFCALGCGAVSDFLSSRIVAWRHRRGAVAVVRMARDRVLSRAGACPVDDRRPNGLVHHWIPWDCWSAPVGCVTAARCRNLCARCAPNRERFSASHPKTNSRRHRLSRIALVVCRHDGEASASATRSAAAAVRARSLRVGQRNRRNISDYGGEIDDERPVRESARQSNAQRRLRSVSNSWCRRVFLSETSRRCKT